MSQDCYDAVQAVYDPVSGTVRGTLPPQSYGRRMRLISIQGPANSQLTIYAGHIPGFAGQITNIFPADVRTYTAESDGPPLDIRASEATTWVWTRGSVAAGQTATASIRSEVY